MTHLASSEDAASPMANQQLQTFQTCIHTLPKTTSNITTSIANSGGVIYWKESHGDWIRPGLMLYGIQPDISRPIDLQPVMTLDTPIIAMRHVVAGEAVGYNQTWRAKRDSVIATVCLGYGDGYPTQITLATPVMILGQRAAIVGRVSMDLITIDVTDLPQTRTGDRVMFWGQDSNGNKLSVEEIAKCAGTIPYDLVSKIGGRVK